MLGSWIFTVALYVIQPISASMSALFCFVESAKSLRHFPAWRGHWGHWWRWRPIYTARHYVRHPPPFVTLSSISTIKACSGSTNVISHAAVVFHIPVRIKSALGVLTKKHNKSMQPTRYCGAGFSSFCSSKLAMVSIPLLISRGRLIQVVRKMHCFGIHHQQPHVLRRRTSR